MKYKYFQLRPFIVWAISLAQKRNEPIRNNAADPETINVPVINLLHTLEE